MLDWVKSAKEGAFYLPQKTFSLWNNRADLKRLEYFTLHCINVLVKKFYLQDDSIGTGEAIQQKAFNLPSLKRLRYFLKKLEQAEMLVVHQHEITLLPNHEISLTDLYQQALQELPNYAGLLKLIKHCFDFYPDVLSGEKNGLMVLFPDGTDRFLRQKLTEESDPFSNAKQFSSAIAGLLASMGGKRIIEVGGGEGELTWSILPLLKANAPLEYKFTDISRSFILKAKREHRQEAYNFLELETLDITQQPDSSLHGHYDIVLAYNVVHVTKDIVLSLRNLRALLKPGGIIILVEAYAPFLWQTFVWGVLDNLWHFEDCLREQEVTLDIQGWKKALNMAGYQELFVYPESSDDVAKNDTGMWVYQSIDNNASEC